jgi:hypothetical protein
MRNKLDAILTMAGSIRLAIGCMAALMLVVFYCTLAQVHLGTFGAVDAYIRTWVVYATLGDRRIPVFPGGGLVGLVLSINLTVGLFRRVDFRWRKAGLWLTHFGILLLVFGEYITATSAVESQLPIQVGETRNWAEGQRSFEVAVADVTDPVTDRVYAIDGRRAARGGLVRDARLPFTLDIKAWLPNAQLVNRPKRHDLPLAATAGMGMTTHAIEMPEVTADDQVNAPAAWIALSAGGKELGTWLVSTDLDVQRFTHDKRTYTIALRATRHYLPFTLTLKEFRHDVYAGTDIPKNFASLIRLVDPGRHEDREVLVFMNHPLRHRGLTFYQASFGMNDKLSVLQVVRNPGWRLPYAACALVALGLAVHFLLLLRDGTA